MEDKTFKVGNIEVTITTFELPNGRVDAELHVTGEKEEVEAFGRDILNSTAHLDLQIRAMVEGQNGQITALKISELMGGN